MNKINNLSTRKKAFLIAAYLTCVAIDKLETIITVLLITILFISPFLCIFILPAFPYFQK